MNIQELFDRYYFSRPGFVNGSVEFRNWCKQSIRQGSDILEIGAGPTNPTSEFLAGIGNTSGVDISEEVLTNRWHRQKYVYDGENLPFAERSFDACVSDFVLEHVENPGKHFREVARVLRPGGVYIFRTPNMWHYVTLASRLLPHAAHTLMANRMRGLAADSHPPYPTFYRANTRVTLERLCQEASLAVTGMRTVEKEPSYGRIHWTAFYVMMSYERLVNGFDALSGLRSNIWAVVSKQSSPR